MEVRRPWTAWAAVLAVAAGIALVRALAPAWLALPALWSGAPVLAFAALALALHHVLPAWRQVLVWACAAYLAIGIAWALTGPGDDTDAGDPLLALVWPVIGFEEMGEALAWWRGPE